MAKKKLKDSKIFAFLVATIVRIYLFFITDLIRYKLIEDEGFKDAKKLLDENKNNKRGFIMVAWHENITLTPGFFFRNQYKQFVNKINVLVSRSRDANLHNKPVMDIGLKLIKGSTAKKGKKDFKGSVASLRQMIETIKKGEIVYLAPDGPRGPAKEEIANGIIYLQQKTKAPLLFISAKQKKERRLRKTWDKHKISFPFEIVYVKLSVVKELPFDKSNFDKAKDFIKSSLNKLES